MDYGRQMIVEKLEKGSERRKKKTVVTIAYPAISVSHRERGRKNGFNTVYVGTEPTALYRSDDGCESWKRMSALNNLKSSSLWSFPPRPWTSHVRWIEPDRTNADYVFAAIEAGALVQSHDDSTINLVSSGVSTLSGISTKSSKTLLIGISS
jgi:hypothetical protein